MRSLFIVFVLSLWGVGVVMTTNEHLRRFRRARATDCRDPTTGEAQWQNGREWSRPSADYRVTREALRFENRDDLVRARIDDEDLVADQNVVVAAPLGIDHDDFHRQRIEMHAIRHAGTHALDFSLAGPADC